MKIKNYLLFAGIAFIIGSLASSLAPAIYLTGFTDGPSEITEMARERIRLIVNLIRFLPLAIVSGIWAAKLAKDEDQNVVAWFIFGFAFDFYAIAIFYAYLIYEKIKTNQNENHGAQPAATDNAV